MYVTVFQSRLNSKKFQNFEFQAKIVIFRENYKYDNLDEFLDFYEFTTFKKIGIIGMAISGISRKSYVDFYEITLVYILWVFIKAWNKKFWNFSEFKLIPSYYLVY